MALKKQPWGFQWRSKPSFIITTVGVGLFTDLVLYGIVVPILPFLLRDRFQVPNDQVQSRASGLLAIYSGASVLFSAPAGWTASKVGSRQLFFTGLAFLFISSTMFAFAKHFAFLVVSRVLQGMSTAVVWAAGLDMVQETVPRGDIGEAIGTIFASTAFGELVAPVLGGAIYQWAGIEGIFGVSIALLVIDFIMRLLLIDKKGALKYINDLNADGDQQDTASAAQGARETDPLLSSGENENDNHDECDDRYKIHEKVGKVFKLMPILYCFRNSRLQMAMILSFIQGSIIGALDATVPTEAESLFGFSSFQVGLIFIALMTPYLTLGRFFGQAVDKYGTRAVTVVSYIYFIPCLLLLGLPDQQLVAGKVNVALFCVILTANGVGVAAVSSAPLVEAIEIVGKYDTANRDFFGEHGPYAPLFGINSVFFFSGLGIGPLVGGALRARFGFGVMGLAFAILAALTALLSFYMIGPARSSKNKRGVEDDGAGQVLDNDDV